MVPDETGLEGRLLLSGDGTVKAMGKGIARTLGLEAAQSLPRTPALAPLIDALADVRSGAPGLLLVLSLEGGERFLSASADRDGEVVVQLLPVIGGIVDLAVAIDSLSCAITGLERPQLALLDPQFVFVWANEAYFRGSGKRREDLIGQDHFLLFPNEENLQIFTRVRDTGQPIRYKAKPFVFADQPERGTTYWDWTLQPVRGPAGTKALLLTLVDVTERMEMTRQLAERAEQLTRSNEELEQFAYVASHDLREPLRMVAGYLGLLERRLQDQGLDERSREYVRFAVDGAMRMDALINDLLAYSRAGGRGGPLTPTDLDRAARTALSHLADLVEGADICLEDLPTVRADERQMVQLFQNLLGNALKYRSERPLRVRVSAHHERGKWVIAVEDNGIGIDPAHQERIFEMFQRLHARDEYEGTGIGLAIAKKIVERHGGRIWVESDGRSGSTFRFSLPD